MPNWRSACASHNGEPAHSSHRARHARAGRAPTPAARMRHALAGAGHGRPQTARARRSATALPQQLLGQARRLSLPGLRAAWTRRAARGFARGYVEPQHAVMREVSAALRAATDCDLARAPVGADGCSIPTFAIPLDRARPRLRTHRRQPGSVEPSMRTRALAVAGAIAPRALHGWRARAVRHARDGSAGRGASAARSAPEGVYCAAPAGARLGRGDRSRSTTATTHAPPAGGDGRCDRSRLAPRTTDSQGCCVRSSSRCATGTAAWSASCASAPPLRDALAGLAAPR